MFQAWSPDADTAESPYAIGKNRFRITEYTYCYVRGQIYCVKLGTGCLVPVFPATT